MPDKQPKPLKSETEKSETEKSETEKSETEKSETEKSGTEKSETEKQRQKSLYKVCLACGTTEKKKQDMDSFGLDKKETRDGGKTGCDRRKT